MTLGLSTLRHSEARSAPYVASEGYGRTYEFSYPNYSKDPRPKVLTLGFWTNKSTKNTILGGINLNYLDPLQLEKLRDNLPVLLKPKTLKDRYRLGLRLLPTIYGRYYRTYRKDYVDPVTPGTLKFAATKDKDVKDIKKDDDRVEKIKKAVAKTLAKTDKLEPTPEKLPDKEQEREYSQEIKKKQRRQRKRREKELEPQDIEDVASEEEPEPDEDLPKHEPKEDDELDPDDLVKPPMEDRDFYYDPNYGYSWTSPKSYIKRHLPSSYLNDDTLIRRDAPLLAVHNLRTGVTIIDNAHDHAQMLLEADWSYLDTVRLLPVNGKVAFLSDTNTKDAAKRIPRLVLESVSRQQHDPAR